MRTAPRVPAPRHAIRDFLSTAGMAWCTAMSLAFAQDAGARPSDTRLSESCLMGWCMTLVVALSLSGGWMLLGRRTRAMARRERARFDNRLRERERIARELHDALLQGTQGLVLNLQVVAGEMRLDDPRRRRLEALLDEADGMMAQARDRVYDLRDLRADAADLVASLCALGNEQTHGGRVRFELLADAVLPALPPETGTEVFFIAREALVNAFRHAQASVVQVEARKVGLLLRIAVRDDGHGIDPEVLAHGNQPGHWGLAGMRERAARIHAVVNVNARVSGGTEVVLELPLRLPLARALANFRRTILSRLRHLFDRRTRTQADPTP
jgi:signal transduction histidine kinase